MNRSPIYTIALAGLMGSLSPDVAIGADQALVQLRKAGGQVELYWHANLQLPVSATFPAYTILRSVDLSTWEPVGGPVNGTVGVSDESLRLACLETGVGWKRGSAGNGGRLETGIGWKRGSVPHNRILLTFPILAKAHQLNLTVESLLLRDLSGRKPLRSKPGESCPRNYISAARFCKSLSSDTKATLKNKNRPSFALANNA